MIKAVIFDLDGTLCNTTEVIEEALRTVFAKHLVHFPDRDVDELISVNIEVFEELITKPEIPLSSATILVWFEVFEKLQMKPSLKTILRLIEHVRRAVNERVRLEDGVLELMEYLKLNDIKIGVLSNGIFIDQANKLIKLKVDNFVDYLVTSDMCAADKPDPRIFKYLLSKLQVLPRETLMIGDNITQDVKGAHALGLRTIYLKRDKMQVVKREVEADHVETNHKDIIQLVKRLTLNQKNR